MNLETNVSRKQRPPNFPKNKHLHPDMHMYVCISGGKQHSFIGEIWRALFSKNTRFEIRSFALLPAIYIVIFVLILLLKKYI